MLLAVLLRKKPKTEESEEETLADLDPVVSANRARAQVHHDASASAEAESLRLEEEAEAGAQEVEALSDDDARKELSSRQEDFLKKKGILVFLLAFSLLQNSAQAQEANPEVAHPETGVIGWWIHPAYAKHLLARDTQLEGMEGSLKQCREALDEKKAEANEIRDAAAIQTTQIRVTRRSLEASNKSRDEARAEVARQKVIRWVVAGVALVLGGVVGFGAGQVGR